MISSLNNWILCNPNVSLSAPGLESCENADTRSLTNCNSVLQNVGTVGISSMKNSCHSWNTSVRYSWSNDSSDTKSARYSLFSSVSYRGKLNGAFGPYNPVGVGSEPTPHPASNTSIAGSSD